MTARIDPVGSAATPRSIQMTRLAGAQPGDSAGQETTVSHSLRQCTGNITVRVPSYADIGRVCYSFVLEQSAASYAPHCYVVSITSCTDTSEHTIPIQSSLRTSSQVPLLTPVQLAAAVLKKTPVWLASMGSEYRNNFRSFSDYSYAGGKFTLSPQAGDKTDGATAAVVPWHCEVTELRKAANSYKIRGWGRETALPHLAQLYSTYENVLEKRIISTLQIDQLQSQLLRRSRDRISGVVSAGSAGRQHSQPPLPHRNRPANVTDKEENRSEKDRRPKSAQNFHFSGGHFTAFEEYKKPVIRRCDSAKQGDTTDGATANTSKRPANAHKLKQNTQKTSLKNDKTTTERQKNVSNDQAKRMVDAKNKSKNTKKTIPLTETSQRERKTNVKSKHLTEHTKADAKIAAATQNQSSGETTSQETKRQASDEQAEEGTSERGRKPHDSEPIEVEKEFQHTIEDDVKNQEVIGSFDSPPKAKLILEPTKMKYAESNPDSPTVADFTVPMDSTVELTVKYNIPDENGDDQDEVHSSEAAMSKNENGMSASFYRELPNAPRMNMTQSMVGSPGQNREDEKDEYALEDVIKEFSTSCKTDRNGQETADPTADDLNTNGTHQLTVTEENGSAAQHRSSSPTAEAIASENHTETTGDNEASGTSTFAQIQPNSFSFSADERSSFDPSSCSNDLPSVMFSNQTLFSSSGVVQKSVNVEKPAYRVI